MFSNNSNQTTLHKQPLLTFWNGLINPRYEPETAVDRRQVRMLASFHLFQIIILLLIAPIIYAAAQPQNRPRASIAASLMLVFLIISYGLCRLLAQKWVAFLTPIASSLFWAATAYSFPESPLYPYLLGYLLVPVLLSSMFLSQRAALIFTIANGILYAIIALTHAPTITLALAGPISLYLLLAGLMLLSRYHQYNMQQERQAMMAVRERELSFYFEHANDWIFMLNPQGVITYVNKLMCEESGYAAAELVGQSPLKFLGQDGANAIAEPMQQILHGNTVEHIEVEVPLRNGRTIWMDIKGLIVVEDQQVMGTFHIARNITAQKMTEAKLQQRHDEISQLYQQAQQEIRERQLAEKAERQQRRFAEALVETVNALHSTHHLPDVLHRVATAVTKAMNPDAIAIMLIRDDNTIQVDYAYGEYQNHDISYHETLKFQVNQVPNLVKMATTQQPILIPDVQLDPEWIFVPEAAWLHCYVGAPIVADGTTIGFLSMESTRPNAYDAEDAEKLLVFAQQVAAAIKNAQLVSDLAQYNDHLMQLVQEQTAELEHSNRQMTAILQNSPDAIALLDVDGTVAAANPAFVQLFQQQAPVGQPLLDLFASEPDSAAIAQAITETLQHGRYHRLETTFPHPNAIPLDIDIALAPIIEQDHISGAVCSLRDISQLKEVSRLKDQFISNISHELRTPIANILLHHDLIVHNPVKQDVYLKRIRSEIDRLIYIIDSLLRLSRLDQKRTLPSPKLTQLAALADAYVQDREGIAAAKGVSLHFHSEPDLPAVPVDPGMIGQALSILLTNATNFTPAGGQITVSVTQQVGNGRSRIGIHVQDTGPGIPLDEQPHIFDRFYRGSSAQSGTIPGTGLGLAIAKEIILMHGGEIEVISPNSTAAESQAGAHFIIWLPLPAETGT